MIEVCEEMEYLVKNIVKREPFSRRVLTAIVAEISIAQSSAMLA